MIELLQAHVDAQGVFISCLVGAMEEAGVITIRHLMEHIGNHDLGMNPVARVMLDDIASVFIQADAPRDPGRAHLRVVD